MGQPRGQLRNGGSRIDPGDPPGDGQLTGIEATLGALRGESPRVVAIRADLTRLLGRPSLAGRLPPILILGETGTGKGFLARAVHDAGPRRAAPFVAINCAAIPDTMLEAELFGYERGAFTDARQGKAGLFQTAQGGTLFLDEIGLLPLALQGKLLAALEDRAVRRLGSTRAEPIDLALVAATSVGLKQAIAAGLFREDLYHRLAVVSFELPPLRERGDDILRLAEHFLARACADYGLAERVLTADARAALRAYHWPGNVRELGNVLERAALLSADDAITAATLNLPLDAMPAGSAPAGAAPAPPAAPGSLDDALRQRIEESLRASGGNIRQAAAALGISRNTLRARMDRYGLRQREPAVRRPAAAAAPGAPGPAPRPAPGAPGPADADWERRHLAVLRARLLAAPTADRVRALAEITDKIRSFGGTVESSTATSVCAVFGLDPVDNAPSHAALAALAIHGAAAHARRMSAEPVDAVLAIDAGEHLVRRRGPDVDIAIDSKAATWSLLDDLVELDSPGATVVTEAVVPFVVRRFALERLHDLPHRAWRLVRRDEGSGVWSRFVGREPEAARIREAVARAEQGRGQVVDLVGEAGVGKSRLVFETVRRLPGWRVVSGRGAAYATHVPYVPLIEIVKDYCGIHDADSADDVRDKLAKGLPFQSGRPDGLMPALLDLVGALPADDPFRTADPAVRRRRLHDAVRQTVIAASTVQPLCLVIEDLHWIDAATQEVLDRLVTAIAEARVLLLLTYRPEYQHAWSSRSHHHPIRLDALPPERTGELLEALLGTDPGLNALKQTLRDRGNPFFLEETVRTLVETHALEGRRGHYRLVRPVQALGVPTTVRAILAARLDRLAPDDRRLLQTAAVIGKQGPLALLQALADGPDASLRQGLEALQEAEFLVETGLYPDLGYRFKHDLTHEVAYGTLLDDRRRQLHARAVQAIEQVYPDRLGDHAERLAHHAVLGEVWDKAATCLRLAGAKALARAANRDAAAFFEQALTAIGRLPPGRQTLEQAIDLRFDLRTSLVPLGAFDRIDSALQEARGLASTLGDPLRSGKALVHLCHYHWMTGRLAEAFDCGREGLAIADAHGDLPLQVMGNLQLGATCLWMGDYRRAESCLLQVLALLDRERGSQGFNLPGAPAVSAHAYLCQVFACQGQFGQGVAHGEAAMRLAESMNRPFDLANARLSLTNLLTAQGHLDRAIALLERPPAWQGEWTSTIFSARSASSLGAAYARGGRIAEGVALLEQSLKATETMRYGLVQLFCLLDLGEAYALADRPEPALDCARRALDLARGSGRRGEEAMALRLLAEAQGRLHRPADAEGHFGEALALATALGMRPLVAHCHAGLARLLRRCGRPDEAQLHLDQASALYRQMDMAHALELAAPPAGCGPGAGFIPA